MSYMYDQDEKHLFYSGKRHLEEEEESINCLTKKNLKLDNQRLEFELNLQKKKMKFIMKLCWLQWLLRKHQML